MKQLVVKFFCLSFILLSCSNESTNSDLININNPNSVSQSIKIEYSTELKGTLPKPSTSETNPILATPDDEILYSIQGSKIIVTSKLSRGNAIGFYVKIDGASNYFKIDSNTANGRVSDETGRIHIPEGRKADSYLYPSFSIEIPINMEPGEFCFSYCVFDNQNQVSNTIKQCLVVAELGGEGSEMLTKNVWDFERSYLLENSIVTDSTIGGLTVEFTNIQSIPCNMDYTVVDVISARMYKSSFIYSENGSLYITGENYHKTLDYDASDCEPIYKESTTPFEFYGYWSYNSKTNSLIEVATDTRGQDITLMKKWDIKQLGEKIVLSKGSIEKRTEITLTPDNE